MAMVSRKKTAYQEEREQRRSPEALAAMPSFLYSGGKEAGSTRLFFD